MEFPEPLPFLEALEKLQQRGVLPSDFDTFQWRMVAAAVRERAFFSSQVESARLLQSMKDYTEDYLAEFRDENGKLVAQGRAEFVANMRELAIREGLGKVDPLTGRIIPEINESDLTDIRSIARLQLIFDTQVESAQEYGYWKQGMDPDILYVFPAQRFIRVRPVMMPRDYHAANEGVVKRKDDIDFWLSMNRDFGVPWGPWGFNSGMGVEDVDRDEAEALGLIRPGERIAMPDALFNQRLQAGIQGMDPGIVAALRRATGGTAANGRLKARENVMPQAGVESVAKAASRNEALAMIQLAKELRGKLKLAEKPAAEIKAAAYEGIHFLERMVHQDLLPKTPVALMPDAENSGRGWYDPAARIGYTPANAGRVAHEIAHAIEFDHPAVYQACVKFRRKRAKGEKLKSLRMLTGNPQYAENEMTSEDEWQKRGGSHYMGRDYTQDGYDTTEILTMGIERMFNDPVGFAQQDAEYFDFILQLIQNQ
jgi:hypothetical protein